MDSVALFHPWGPDATGTFEREFLALQMNVPADGKVAYDALRHLTTDGQT